MFTFDGLELLRLKDLANHMTDWLMQRKRQAKMCREMGFCDHLDMDAYTPALVREICLFRNAAYTVPLVDHLQ